MSVETASQCSKVDFKPPIEGITQTSREELLEVFCEKEQMRKKGHHTWFYIAKLQ
jgi:hypothetical protein